MSKIYEFENQVILRLPEEIAEKVHMQLDANEKIENLPDTIELTPFFKRNEDKNDLLCFTFKYGDFVSQANLVELPCLIESYKTLDYVNLFKSNDICQMIVVHPNKNATLEKGNNKLFKKFIKKTGQYDMVRYSARDGLTTPSIGIRSRFFRKKVKANPEDVRTVDRSLENIIKDLSKQRNSKKGIAATGELDNDDTSSIQSRNGKRRYRRKL